MVWSHMAVGKNFQLDSRKEELSSFGLGSSWEGLSSCSGWTRTDVVLLPRRSLVPFMRWWSWKEHTGYGDQIFCCCQLAVEAIGRK